MFFLSFKYFIQYFIETLILDPFYKLRSCC